MKQPLALTAVEQREMERLKQELGTRFCRRCDYCQPCQQGIPISDAITFPSLLKRQTPERLFSGRFGESLEKAADCIECGECESRCPFDVEVIPKMRQAAVTFGG